MGAQYTAEVIRICSNYSNILNNINLVKLVRADSNLAKKFRLVILVISIFIQIRANLFIQTFEISVTSFFRQRYNAFYDRLNFNQQNFNNNVCTTCIT